MTESDQPQRRLRSFVRRQGRLTEGQSRALDTLWQTYGLEVADGMLSFPDVFGNDGDVIVEIGFGNGTSLLEMAQTAPDKNFIGVEVHRPGVGKLINDSHHAGVTNVRTFCDDAIDVLQHNIPANSLAGVQLFFQTPGIKSGITSAALCSLSSPRRSGLN